MPTSFVLSVTLWLGPTNADPPAKTKPVPVEEVRRVVEAVVRAAEENATAAPRSRRDGDALADYYIRRAAATAHAHGLSPRAFLQGLGVALDSTDLIRNNPLLRPMMAQVEDDDQRQRRLKVLGKPTLRGRHDWLLHYVISAALAARFSQETAEQFGLAKELWDMRGASGFSFGDLAADYAGLAFARSLLDAEDQGKGRLAELARGFRGADFLPKVEDLEEGLNGKRFTEKYGSTSDPRFVRQCEAIRRRVREAPGFRPAP